MEKPDSGRIPFVAALQARINRMKHFPHPGIFNRYIISPERSDEKMAEVIAVVNQKGGVGKTTTVACLGMGLAARGKKVLLVDLDAQGSLGICLGYDYPEKYPVTMVELLAASVTGELDETKTEEAVLPYGENVDCILSHRGLTTLEFALLKVEAPSHKLAQVLSRYQDRYDYILLDGPPMFGLLTMNMLCAADRVLVPVQAEYLAVKGLEQMLRSISGIMKTENPSLRILGILPSMVNDRTRDARDVLKLLEKTYGNSIRILPAIPFSVRAKEISSRGKTIYQVDKGGKVTGAYERLVDIVLESCGKEAPDV